jgi:hypothetical protein
MIAALELPPPNLHTLQELIALKEPYLEMVSAPEMFA